MKGKAEGEAIGIEKGKLEAAKKMKTEGISMETICRCTGLTAEQVAAL